MSDNITIQVFFIGKPQWEGGWPYVGFDNESLIKSILDHLNEKFPKIEFKANEMIGTYDKNLVEKIKKEILEADGLIIYTIGHYGDPGLIQSGIEIIECRRLPIILANLIYAGDHTFTKIFVGIKDKNLPVYAISSKNLEDFDKPIEIMHNILRIKEKRISVYASDSSEMNWKVILGLINPERKNVVKEFPDFIEQVGKLSDEKFEFYTDFAGIDQAHQWRIDEKKYQENLKNIFGVEMIRENPDDILKYYNEADKEGARKIAEKWTENAKIVEPTEKTILNSAKLYLGFKNMIRDKKSEIFTPDCGTFLLTGKMPAFPCMAFFELTNEGHYGICESDMDSAISYLFGLYLTNRPGFVSNHTLDTVNNQITYMHCVGANRLLGIDGPPAEYDIIHHGESGFIGACPRIKFPIGEIVTTIKISVFEGKIEIRQGKIIGNPEDKGGCVSKMLVESNVNKILETYDWETFGWHRISFIGDWKEEFMIGAKLLGLKIIDQTN
ncbi:MAG: hypothetical protein ACFE9Q_10760 [Candidatus Hodarchaeota archaeon]